MSYFFMTNNALYMTAPN